MSSYGNYPYQRLRRNRKSDFIRKLVQEHHLLVTDLVYPVFIVDGKNREESISSLPGQKRFSIDQLLKVANECSRLGIQGLALFPMIEGAKNDKFALESYNPDGLVPRAVNVLKHEFPNLGIFTDIALDAYTPDGHDGVVDEHGYVSNDLTNEILAKQALCHAQAGADFVCPSDMMDGRVLKIRATLDNNNFVNTGIMAYSAKYASTLYGPFRDATGAVSRSGSSLGKSGKTTYQMNPANSHEAIHEARLDLYEGADIIMVKPGLPYLDVVYRIKSEFKKPTAVYHVSGEYAMLKQCGDWLDYDRAVMEVMLCFKRAGADIIWTYAAIEVANLLRTGC
ncbi:MAG: porphobilinogen synthase [Pseudomonadota bacterium]|nr:porphobilinogen synthase [Pseudomonadota bacterium]